MREHDADLVEVGKIRKPIGLDGACGVTPNGMAFQRMALPCSVKVGGSPVSLRDMVVVSANYGPKGYLCRFEGIESVEAAEELRNLFIYIARSELPAAGASEFYHFELEGSRVVRNDNGEDVGIVKGVHNYPSVDALEVETRNREVIMIPITGDAVVDINREERVITVNASHIEELLF